MAGLIIHDSFLSSRACAEQVHGVPEKLRVILFGDDGSQKVLFEGEEFSEDDWKKKMRAQRSTPYVEKHSPVPK